MYRRTTWARAKQARVYFPASVTEGVPPATTTARGAGRRRWTSLLYNAIKNNLQPKLRAAEDVSSLPWTTQLGYHEHRHASQLRLDATDIDTTSTCSHTRNSFRRRHPAKPRSQHLNWKTMIRLPNLNPTSTPKPHRARLASGPRRGTPAPPRELRLPPARRRRPGRERLPRRRLAAGSKPAVAGRPSGRRSRPTELRHPSPCSLPSACDLHIDVGRTRLARVGMRVCVFLKSIDRANRLKGGTTSVLLAG